MVIIFHSWEKNEMRHWIDGNKKMNYEADFQLRRSGTTLILWVVFKTIYSLRPINISFFLSFLFHSLFLHSSTLPDPLLSFLVFFIPPPLINENMKLVNSQSGYSTGLPSILFAITLLCSSVTAAPSNSTTSHKSDPCAAIAGKTTATFHEAKACLDHFPYNETIASQTLDTVRKVTKELYVFNVSLGHQ
jgi:hypothetical protein